MKKTISILVLFNLVFFLTNAQEKTKDYKINTYSITINHFTPELITAINSLENKGGRKVVISKEINQSDFKKICEEFTWISNFEVGSRNEHIVSIEPISNLKSLKKLRLSSMQASKETPINLQPLETLTGLIDIDFFATRVTNTDILKNLNQLQHVSLYMSSVSSISFLKKTPNIEKLSLYGFGHTFENYKPVSGLKALKELNIYMNKQATDENLEVLKSLTTLREIQMANDLNVTSLNFLENNVNIEEIHATWCANLSDFSALSNFKKLKILSFQDTKLEGLDMLKGITTLTSIDVSKTKIKDISFLKNCLNLETIKISKTLVDDISPLFECKNIWTIELSSIVPEEQIEKLKSLNPKMSVTIKD